MKLASLGQTGLDLLRKWGGEKRHGSRGGMKKRKKKGKGPGEKEKKNTMHKREGKGGHAER